MATIKNINFDFFILRGNRRYRNSPELLAQLVLRWHPFLYRTWPFITFFKVMWFAVSLWYKCCSCLSWLAGHFPAPTVVRHTWVSPVFSTRLHHHTSVSLWSHYSVLVNKSAAVFEHYLWHFFSDFLQDFPALWDYRWGQLRMIFTALQRAVLVRLSTSYRNVSFRVPLHLYGQR